MLVRRIRETDSFAELTALLHRAYAPLARQGMRFVASWQDEARTRERASEGDCFIGLVDGRIVATVTVEPPSLRHGSPWYCRPEVASLHQLAVDPDLQGGGLGSRMLAVAEARALELGVTELALDTSEHATPLIELYSRRGYRFIEHAQWPDVNYRSLVLSKRLASTGPDRPPRSAPSDPRAP